MNTPWRWHSRIGALALYTLSQSGTNPVLFVLVTALYFGVYGEIFSLFPATQGDTFGSKFAAANNGMLYTAKGAGALLVPFAAGISQGTRLVRRVRDRDDVQPDRRGAGAVRAEAHARAAFREDLRRATSARTSAAGVVPHRRRPEAPAAINPEFGGSMATVNPVSIQPKATTAEDTLQRKSRDASVISGGHLVAKALKNEGVDTIFTLCGGHIIDIYDGCVDEGIRIIDVRHEQVAAHAADGYARQTGKLGCVVTTAGPGCTNAVTGIATAFRSESPILHIGGQGALTQHKMGSLQDLPHVDLMTPITKFAATVSRAPSAWRT